MNFAIAEINPTLGFAARVTGIDLGQPLAPGVLRRIVEAFNRYAVLVFPDQALDDAAQLRFSQLFGPLETSLTKDRVRAVEDQRISNISNIDEHGNKLDPEDERAAYNRGNQLWHSDSSFKPIPALASLLSGREVPPAGGETEFADLRAAYDALPAATREAIKDLVAEHNILYSRSTMGYTGFSAAERKALPAVLQRLVRRHPATGRRALYVGSHASHIVGWPVKEGRELLRELLVHATAPQFVYSHRWTTNDLVMWDNRAVVHRGRPWDEGRYRRVMHRTTVMGDGPTVPLDRMTVEAQARARDMITAA